MARGIPAEYLTVNGTLKATYERANGDWAAPWVVAQAVAEGYACGECREYRAFRGACLPSCPTCGLPTGAAAFTDPWWLE